MAIKESITTLPGLMNSEKILQTIIRIPAAVNSKKLQMMGQGLYITLTTKPHEEKSLNNDTLM